MWLYELVYVSFINNIIRKQCFEQQWYFVSLDELPHDHMAWFSQEKPAIVLKTGPHFSFDVSPTFEAYIFGMQCSNGPQNRASKLIPMENDI